MGKKAFRLILNIEQWLIGHQLFLFVMMEMMKMMAWWCSPTN